MKEALADLRDLCCQPPGDPGRPNHGCPACNSAVAGEALVALEALYDPQKMRLARRSGNFRDGVDVVRRAQAALLTMQRHPERHLYQPLTECWPAARDPGIPLDQVLVRLLNGVDGDFRPEIDEFKRARGGSRSA
jgi:hypothetical protein